MSSEPTKKKFDCIKFTREARRKIYEETKHMSHEELAEYYRKFRENDPVWQRWVTRKAQQQGADTA